MWDVECAVWDVMCAVCRCVGWVVVCGEGMWYVRMGYGLCRCRM